MVHCLPNGNLPVLPQFILGVSPCPGDCSWSEQDVQPEAVNLFWQLWFVHLPVSGVVVHSATALQST